MNIVLSILCIFLLIISIFFSKAIEKQAISRWLLYLHFGVWLGSISLSVLNLYGLFEVSPKVYTIILVNVFAFFFGFVAIKTFNACDKNKIICVIHNTVTSLHKNKAWAIFCLLFLLVNIYIVYKYANVLLLYTVNDVAKNRSLLFEDGSLISSVNKYLLPAINYIIIFLLAYSVLFCRNWKYITLYFACACCKSIVGGSRGSIMVIFIFLLVLLIINQYFAKDFLIKLNKSLKIGVIILTISVYCIAGFLSFQRSRITVDEDKSFTLANLIDGCNELNKDIIVYTIGPFRALDHAFSNHYPEKAEYPLLGRSTFMGLEGFISMFSTQLGVPIKTVYDKTIARQQADVFVIGYYNNQTILFNYAYTNAMIFYYDGGLLGVFIFSFLFGVFVKVIINLFLKRPNIYFAILVVFLFYCITRVIFQWTFINPAVYVFLAICLIGPVISNLRLHCHKK